MKIIEILRLTDLGYSQRDIGSSIGHGKSTVGDVQQRCRELDINYNKAKEMTNEALYEQIYPDSTSKRYIKPEPDYAKINKELLKHRKLNLSFMWEEYKRNNPDGLEYSQFCNRFKEWKTLSGENLSMYQEREPGKELFVDWMGDKFNGVVSADTGEIIPAHIFVSALGNSCMPYVEAFPDEKIDKWLVAHRHAFEYYDGVPRILVPDNCKTAVTKANRYDPTINPAYQEFAAHYDVAVIPARIKKPKDKSTVEGSVGWLETWLLGRLRNQTFFSFEELNQTIKIYVSELSYRSFQKRSGSRISVFKELDQPCLRPLPIFPYECVDTVTRTVPDNYHIEYEGFYYSVPFTLFKQKVTAKASSTMIEIFDVNRVRVASHIRRRTGKRYISDPAHMPENHRKFWESKQFDSERYLLWAKNIGPNTYHAISTLLSSNKIEEQSYKSCMGILQFSKKYSKERLENACLIAKQLDIYSYSVISNILKTGQDLLVSTTSSTKPTPPHENVRGAEYYR